MDGASQPLKNPPGWGSIKEVVNAPLIDVPPASWWISVIGMWLTLPLTILVCLPTLCSSCLFVAIMIGCCNCGCCVLFSQLGSVKNGNPLWLAPNEWRAGTATIFYFIKSSATRLKLFINEWKAFGSGELWYHGEGIWCWSYEECDKILKGAQLRQLAFGCVKAPVPDMFPSKFLIFLPNEGGESEWSSVRFAMHQVFFAPAAKRMAELREKVATVFLPSPQMDDLNDADKLSLIVAKCMAFLLFGVQLDDEDANVFRDWNTAAKTTIFPRGVQRLAFNKFINTIKALREKTVGLVEKHGLQGMFVEMNGLLPGKYRREPVVKLCDEVMYALSFAGINGTSAAVRTTAAFLQVKYPPESAKELIDFGKYSTSEDMLAIYKKSPMNYIKEACRLDPPVTSATTSLAEDEVVTLAGRQVALDKGTLKQYTLSMANRDEKVFGDPNLFNPDRGELHKALTWNGAFGSEDNGRDEETYPRICPGRYLAIDVVSSIIDRIIGNEGP